MLSAAAAAATSTPVLVLAAMPRRAASTVIGRLFAAASISAEAAAIAAGPESDPRCRFSFCCRKYEASLALSASAGTLLSAAGTVVAACNCGQNRDPSADSPPGLYRHGKIKTPPPTPEVRPGASAAVLPAAAPGAAPAAGALPFGLAAAVGLVGMLGHSRQRLVHARAVAHIRGAPPAAVGHGGSPPSRKPQPRT